MNTWGFWVLLIGMAILLIAVFSLLGRVKKLADQLSPAETAASEGGAEVPEGIPGEVIAAITGALMAYAQPGKTLAVRSIRRVPDQGAWARAARMEQVNNRI